jgi:4-hydroxybenzoate polyprenyltransferase
MQYLQLIRLKHWIKNSFIFLPVFFAGKTLSLEIVTSLLAGFISFGLVASCIYIINDIKDIKNDQLHPKKKYRPLAAGKIRKNTAIIIAIVLATIGFSLAVWFNFKYAFVLSIYFFMNLAYTFGLKKISILDIVIVSIGFVLRIKSGSILTEIPLSQWIIIMVFLLALFMAIAKRRDDIVLKLASGKDLREVSKTYNIQFLDTILSLVSGVIIVSYIMYTIDSEVLIRFGTHRLFYTSLFVIAGIMRYLQIALVENNSGSPTSLLYKDRFIQICIFLWGLSFYFLIYFKDVVLFE